jgi:hypothetical protein
MPKVVFLVGLCGSGKSHLAKQLDRETGAIVFDGVMNSRALVALQECLGRGEDCIVEEISLCIAANRDMIAGLLGPIHTLQFEWIFFENDLESANWNVNHRENKGDPEGHCRINAYVHRRYTIPDGAKLLKITRIPGQLIR